MKRESKKEEKGMKERKEMPISKKPAKKMKKDCY